LPVFIAGLLVITYACACTPAGTSGVNEIVVDWGDDEPGDDSGNPVDPPEDPEDPPVTPPDDPEPSGPVARCRVSDGSGYDSADEKIIRNRAKIYSEIGVNHVRWGMVWPRFEVAEGSWKNLSFQPFKYLKIMTEEFGMKITFIPNIASDVPSWMKQAHPDCYLKSNDGLDGCLSYWYPGFMDVVKAKTETMIAKMKAAGIWDYVDLVEPALGMAGEPIYPPAWTMGLSEEKFWCYDENAIKDFRAKMEAKYSSITLANTKWSTSFASWDDVTVYQPGKKKGKYWEDVLTWYRDTKREKVIEILDYYKEILEGTGKHVLINVPGVQYTASEWNSAINSVNGGNGAIRIMNDSDFLLDWACENGEYVEYTGLGPGSSNVAEITRIVTYIRSKGYDNPVWAENVGDEGTASQIDNLKQQVLGNKLYGFDYTHAHFLFNSDGTLIEDRANKLKSLYEELNKMWEDEE